MTNRVVFIIFLKCRRGQDEKEKAIAPSLQSLKPSQSTDIDTHHRKVEHWNWSVGQLNGVVVGVVVARTVVVTVVVGGGRVPSLHAPLTPPYLPLERVRARASVCVSVCMCVCACVRARVRVCVRVRACVF